MAIHHALQPITEAVQVVGALRRRSALASWIDVLAVCKVHTDLLGAQTLMREEIVAALRPFGVFLSSTAGRIALAHRTGALINCHLRDPGKTTWAWAVLLHTGPVAYSDAVARGLRTAGFGVDGEAVFDGDGRPFMIQEESEICEMAHVAHIEPRSRADWCTRPANLAAHSGGTSGS